MTPVATLVGVCEYQGSFLRDWYIIRAGLAVEADSQDYKTDLEDILLMFLCT